MARIKKAQKAGLDFLDQIFFHDLVVHQGMDAHELKQLDTVIARVSEMVKSRYFGREAEIIKHFAYFLLEVNLTNYGEKYWAACPVTVAQAEAVEQHSNNYQAAMMMVLIERKTGIDLRYALEILLALKDEFVGYSPLVRQDLLRRCFVREFSNSPLQAYCWLIVAEVLPVTKNCSERLSFTPSEELQVRLSLLADYEMILHHFTMTISKNNPTSVFLGRKEFELTEGTIESLLEIDHQFRNSSYKQALRSIPVLTSGELPSNERVQRFFEMWADRKSRLRMHRGTPPVSG